MYDANCFLPEDMNHYQNWIVPVGAVSRSTKRVSSVGLPFFAQNKVNNATLAPWFLKSVFSKNVQSVKSIHQYFRFFGKLPHWFRWFQRGSFFDFMDQSIFWITFLKNNDFRADFWWALDTLVLLVMFLIDIIPCFFGKFFCSDVSRIAPMRFVLLQCREKSETSNLIPIP